MAQTLLGAMQPVLQGQMRLHGPRGELFNNPEVKNPFTKSGHTIHPTGANSSHQNGPVERGHRTVADTMRAFLTGANLLPKFWPCAFHHTLRVRNATPT